MLLLLLSAEEDRRLREVVEQCKGAGARMPWAKVAAQLPDRTDNGCKRRYLQLAKGLPEGAAQCGPPVTSSQMLAHSSRFHDEVHVCHARYCVRAASSAADARSTQSKHKNVEKDEWHKAQAACRAVSLTNLARMPSRVAP